MEPHPGELVCISVPHAFDGERFVPGGARVLVRNGLIVSLLPGEGNAPRGCRVLHHPGATVLPGLIDSHVHLCAGGEADALTLVPGRTADDHERVIRESLRLSLAAGITAVRDLGDQGGVVLARRSRPDEPVVVGSGPPLTSPGGHCAALGGEIHQPGDVAAAVQDRADRGAGVVKVIVSGGAMTAGSDLLASQFSTAQVRAVVVAAHAVGLPVTAHAHSVPSVRASLAAGVDGIEHCTCLTEGGVDTDPSLDEALARSGVVVAPTLGRVPGSSPSPQAVETMRRTGLTVEARFAHVARLHRAGAVLVAGSDAGIHPGKPHGVLPHSVLELAGCGLSTAEALAAATSRAADACRLGDRTGRLRAGLRADLLVVDGDVQTRLAHLTAVRAVYLAGTLVRSCSVPDGDEH